MSERKHNHSHKEYLSTRESAKHLQVSLGTVQKMVETGELLAWKTRGGHRRILMSSLEQLIKRRRLGLKEKCKERIVMLAVLHQVEEFESWQTFVNAWEAQVNLHSCVDSLEALMFSVSLAPDIIYLDHAMTPIEQVHVLHYLTRNTHTRNIPILVEEKFLKMHPHVQQIESQYPNNFKADEGSYTFKTINNPLIRAYEKDDLLIDNEVNMKYVRKIESLVLDSVARKCEKA